METPTFTAPKRNEPDWFRIGRDAVHVMERLGGMKELDFYLRHPEPFIRLHAIRRVAVLLLPDAVPTLAKMLEDPLENEQNRDEAGWAIRRISRAKGLSWFAKTPWTDRYDGTESPASRYGVTIAASGPSPEPVYEAADTEEARLEDEVLLRIQMEEKEIRVEFSPFPWLARNGGYLAKAILFGIGRGIRWFLLFLGRLLAFLGRSALHAVRASRERHATRRARRLAESEPQAAQETDVLAESPRPFGHASLSGPTPSGGQAADGTPVDGVAGRIAGLADPAARPVFLIGAREAGYPVQTVPTATDASDSADAPRSPFPSIPAPHLQSPATLPGMVQAPSPAVPSIPVPKAKPASSLPAASATPAIHAGQFAGLRNNRIPRHAGRHAGKGGNSVFKLLFYPIRLVRQHWLFTLLILCLFYVILSFSHLGRTFVHTLNPQALRVNDRLISVVRVGVLDFLGVSPSGTPQPASVSPSPAGSDASATSASTGPDVTEAAAAQVLARRVSAPKGLNLRASPSPSAARIVWMPLDAQVVLLGETKTDDSGDLWQSVQYGQRSGWALDKWLAPVEPE